MIPSSSSSAMHISSDDGACQAAGGQTDPVESAEWELRFSRQTAVLGREGMRRLTSTTVAVIGLKGVGVEVAKNLAMTAVKSILLIDDGVIGLSDLASQFLFRKQDVGKNRAVVCMERLMEFGDGAGPVVRAVPGHRMGEVLSECHVAVASGGQSFSGLVSINQLCRQHGVKFVAAETKGVFSYVFNDMGEGLEVLDPTGEPPPSHLIASVTQDYPATVTVVEEQRLGLVDGDMVVFSGVKGMDQLNDNQPRVVKVTGSHSFTIPDDSRSYGLYVSGGQVQRLQTPIRMDFLPLEKAILEPQFSTFNEEWPDRAWQAHIAFRALDEYQRRRGGVLGLFHPKQKIDDDDADELVRIAHEICRSVCVMGSSSYPAGAEGHFCSDDGAGAVEGEGVCRVAAQMADGAGSSSSNGGCLQDEHSDHGNGFNGRIAMQVDDGQGMGVVAEDEEEAAADGSGGAECETRSQMLTGSGEGKVGDMHSMKVGQRMANDGLLRALLRTARAELCPMVAVVGGIAAMEAIKGCTGVFTPIHQWLYFDAMDCLPVEVSGPEETQPSGSLYDSQILVFGKSFQEQLTRMKWLVVGAGGIGCEALKNLTMMGIGCGEGGGITVTDADCVRRPHLSAQVLYRTKDLHRPKATVAGEVLKQVNPSVQIDAHQQRFDAESESVFDSLFFESLSGVLSAVGDSTSRLYIDMRSVYFRKPMIDGGTLGMKGNVQVFVPHHSEVYNTSTRDPPEKEIPICTLKNFPYAPEHTVRWAVDLFESMFKQRPVDVNEYLSKRDFLEQLKKIPASRLPTLETLRDSLVRHRPLSFDACIEWARLQFEELFVNNIKQLLYNFPPDMITSLGTPFWSGTKRVPTPLTFDSADPLHLEFIIAAANLQGNVYGLRGSTDHSTFIKVLKDVTVPPFERREGVKIAVTDSEARALAGRGGSGAGSSSRSKMSSASAAEQFEAADACERILKEMPSPASLAGYRLTPVDYDKDDERNLHVEFVSAAANLRALNYGIPTTNKLQARLVAGKIQPSIITSTAVAAGLMCLEIYKLVQRKDPSTYRNTSFNLALPSLAQAQPTPAVVQKVETRDGRTLAWTLWDRFEMDGINMTLEQFLKEFSRQHGLEITMLSFGKSLLYAEFLPKKRMSERLPMTMQELVSVIGKAVVPSNEKWLTFSISCTDVHGNDVEVPDLSLRIR
ncbi:hypothetical protein CBR_g39452 [Chara braunii]|uniref:Ubiquitin-activating enzyme E1 C-terminal domain-containing protein n=1 Tax=Chara braunii TaxID=69332 RepID=A0A388LRL9_CHABU|nr:hypothetical protein CBR_g39452 [Chara braunii]|eukprot:GBG84988.1 hypothetical protein CBR_g39452 [Chara braunii]